MIRATPVPFRFCPACAAPGPRFVDDKCVQCAQCGFRYFHNVAVAVSVVLRCGDQVLLARRARDPAAGRFDFPGGFVDPGETLEAACRRELHEELGLSLDPAALRYLFSSTNRYPYAGVEYRTSDAYFGLVLAERPTLRCADDVAEAVWSRPDEILPGSLSFDTVAQAVDRLRDGALERLLPTP